jgi:hypothetical protein
LESSFVVWLDRILQSAGGFQKRIMLVAQNTSVSTIIGHVEPLIVGVAGQVAKGVNTLRSKKA